MVLLIMEQSWVEIRVSELPQSPGKGAARALPGSWRRRKRQSLDESLLYVRHFICIILPRFV